MKLKRIVIAIMLLSILTGTLLTGCKKSEAGKADEQQSNSASEVTSQQSTSASEITSQQETSQSTQHRSTLPDVSKTAPVDISINDGILKASSLNAADKSNLAEILGYLMSPGTLEYYTEPPVNDGEGYFEKDYFNHNFKSYNYKSGNAEKQAYGYIVGASWYSLIEYMAEVYHLDKKSLFSKFSEEKSDPLGLFYDHIKYDAKEFDTLLTMVFNVTPDHKIDLKNAENEKFGYYYADSFYTAEGGGGDGAGPKININEIKPSSDNKFSVVASYYYGNDGGYDFISKIKVEASLKEYKGKHIWSFYTIDKI